MLVVALVSHVDLGVRIVLTIYPFLAVLAARGVVSAWSACRLGARACVARPIVALVAAALVIPMQAWPDYLAYFNPVAGARPERVLVDSNLDWGQDLYRLADTVRARHIDSVRVHYFGSSDLDAVGLANARRLDPNERTTGWVAASETFLAGVWSDTSLRWLARRTPVARIGPSMRLYYIAPDSTQTRESSAARPPSPRAASSSVSCFATTVRSESSWACRSADCCRDAFSSSPICFICSSR